MTKDKGKDMSRKALTVLAFLLSMFVQNGLAFAQEKTKVTVASPTTVVISMAPLILAQAGGYFEAENLDVVVVNLDGAGVILPQLAQKRIQFGFLNPDSLILADQSGKEKLSVVGVYNALRQNIWEIVVLDDSPIKSLQDLKGKKIGVGSLNWSSLTGQKAMLQELGINPETDVQILPVSVLAPAFRALATKQIDALILFDTHRVSLEDTGTKIRQLPFPPKYRHLVSNSYMTHQDFVRQNPKLVAGFGRALAKATVACEANPAACAEAFWSKYPAQRPKADTPEESLKRGVRALEVRLLNYTYFAKGEPRNFGSYPKGAIEAYVEILRAGGQIKTGNVKVGDLFTNELVSTYNNFDPAEVAAKAKAGKR